MKRMTRVYIENNPSGGYILTHLTLNRKGESLRWVLEFEKHHGAVIEAFGIMDFVSLGGGLGMIWDRTCKTPRRLTYEDGDYDLAEFSEYELQSWHES